MDPKPTSSRLLLHEKINLSVAILSFITSLIFAIWGIVLTKRYGDNKDQINKLTDIVKHQEKQNQKTDDMISKLIIADSLSQQENNELKIQTLRLNATVTALDTQVTITRSNRQDEKYQAFLQEKRSVIEIQKMLQDFEMLTPPTGAGYFAKLPKDGQKDFLKKFKFFLEEYASNSLLIEDDSLSILTNVFISP